MTDATQLLENAVLETSPHDLHDLGETISRADMGMTDAAEALAEGDVVAEVELISPEVWGQQWGLLHDMLGGMVQARTGNPCPLGAQARSEGGQIACQAAYDLIKISPACGMILGAHSTFAGQVLAVGMHGFACVQIVKTARGVTIDANSAEFRSARTGTEAA